MGEGLDARAERRRLIREMGAGRSGEWAGRSEAIALAVAAWADAGVAIDEVVVARRLDARYERERQRLADVQLAQLRKDGDVEALRRDVTEAMVAGWRPSTGELHAIFALLDEGDALEATVVDGDVDPLAVDRFRGRLKTCRLEVRRRVRRAGLVVARERPFGRVLPARRERRSVRPLPCGARHRLVRPRRRDRRAPRATRGGPSRSGSDDGPPGPGCRPGAGCPAARSRTARRAS